MIRIIENGQRVKIVLFDKIKFSMKYDLFSYVKKAFIPPHLKGSEKRLAEKKYSFEEVCRTLKAKEIFPKNILSIKDTVDYVINNKVSVSRVGDGEELAHNILKRNCKFPELAQKLTCIMKEGTNEKCLVCVNNFNGDSEDVPIYWRRHFLSYWTNVVRPEDFEKLEFDKNGMYGDAYAFLFYFNKLSKEQIEEGKRYIEQIWNGKKVLFVVNRDSKILKDNVCFKDVAEKAYIYGPECDAYASYKEIYEQIKNNYDKDWLVYIEMGAMATILAYELSELGYQALDMGHFYSRIYVNIEKTHLD